MDCLLRSNFLAHVNNQIATLCVDNMEEKWRSALISIVEILFLFTTFYYINSESI